MNKKIASEFTIGVIILITIIIGGIFWIQGKKDQLLTKSEEDKKFSQSLQSQKIISGKDAQEVLPSTDETENWQTYTNKELGFEFKYPESGYEFHIGDAKKDEPQFFVKNKTDADNNYYTLDINYVLKNASQKGLDDFLAEQKRIGHEYNKTVIAGVTAYKGDYEDIAVYEIMLNNNERFSIVIKKNDIGEKILSTFKFTQVADEATADWQVYENDKYKYAFKAPKEFVIKEFRQTEAPNGDSLKDIEKKDVSISGYYKGDYVIINTNIGNYNIDDGKCAQGDFIKIISADDQKIEICKGDKSHADFYSRILRTGMFLSVSGYSNKTKMTQEIFEKILSTFKFVN